MRTRVELTHVAILEETGEPEVRNRQKTQEQQKPAVPVRSVNGSEKPKVPTVRADKWQC